jgi:phosphatidyl-myo-inositol dimannoside synthase
MAAFRLLRYRGDKALRGPQSSCREHAEVLLLLVSDLAAGGGIGRLSGQYIRALEEEGVSVSTLSRRPGTPVAAHLRLLSEAISQPRPSLILCNHVNLTPTAVALGRIWRRPVACLLHGEEVWSASNRRIVGSAASQVNRLLAVSKYTATVAQEKWGLRNDQVDTIYPSFAKELGSPGTKLRSEPSRPFLFLSVSRLVDSKGLLETVRAMTEVANSGVDCNLRIVGAGPLQSELQWEIDSQGLSDRVSLVGHVADRELADEYASADAFVLPSTKEGFGLVYLEAMSAGLPIIAARATAVPEVVTAECGYLVDMSRDEELAEAMIELAQGVRYGSMSAGSLNRVQAFSHARFRESVRELVLGVCR